MAACLSLFAHLMHLLGLAGYSGSGKTTLLEKLIPLLRAQGLRIAVIKHTHHDVDWDQPGKDSWRHRHAGAAQVLLAAGKRRLLVEELPDSNDLPLIEHLRLLRPCDLVLAEGFKRAPIAKIEVVNHALGAPRLSPADAGVLAVAADRLSDEAVPCFLRDDASAIAAFILSRWDSLHVDF